jgi:hypothetical protein
MQGTRPVGIQLIGEEPRGVLAENWPKKSKTDGFSYRTAPEIFNNFLAQNQARQTFSLSLCPATG